MTVLALFLQVFDMFAKRMAKPEHNFMDIMDGMHFPKLSMENHSNTFVLKVALDSDSVLDAKDLQISLDGSRLTIFAEHHERSEFSESTYTQQLSVAAIPLDVDVEKAESEFDQKTHTLTITLPKVVKELAKKKKIPIKGPSQ